MNVRRVFGILALAMTAVAVSACGNYVNDQTGDDLGVEVASKSAVTGMGYSNDADGTRFSWTPDGSTWYRVQVYGVLVTEQLQASEICTVTLCTTPPLPVRWTNPTNWYVQGSIDAPRWASSQTYTATDSAYQPIIALNLDTAQTGNQMTFIWARSQYADHYRLQVPPLYIGTLTPTQAQCDNAGSPICRWSMTIPYSYSGKFWVQANGVGPVGLWVGKDFSVAETIDTLAKPTTLVYQQSETGVRWSWDRVQYATHYRLQVPSRFVYQYSAADAHCGAGESTCWVDAPLPVSSGIWYVQAQIPSSDPPVSSAWAGAPYDIELDVCAAPLPSNLDYTQEGGNLVFTWTHEGAAEYKLQVVSNFVIVLNAADICSGGVCSTSQPVKAGSGNWYVQARGYCAPYEAAWTNWIGSTYVIEYPDCSPTDLVISQIYTAGGNTNAYYDRDFVELHNRSAVETINLAGMSLQQASGTGTNWALMELTGTIPPGGYFLVGMVAGTNGIPVPTPDLNGTLGYGAASGKAALVSTTAKLPAEECPTQNIIDFISYGTASACDGSPTGALSTTTSAQRNDAGCIDTDNNLNDFTVGSVAGAPRNSSTARVHCGCN